MQRWGEVIFPKEDPPVGHPPLQEALFRETLEDPGLLNTQAYFLHGEGMAPVHPEDWSGCCLTTWLSFCFSIEPAFLNPRNPEHCLGPSPKLCLPANRTILMTEAPRTLHPPSIEYILTFITNPPQAFTLSIVISQQNSFLLQRSGVLCCFAREFLCNSAQSFLGIIFMWKSLSKVLLC